MQVTNPVLGPVVALVAWSLVMWTWMYATRLPVILKTHMVLDPNAPRGAQMDQLPPAVRWKADNYNHLMEQPTIFYAITLALALMGENSGASLALAWGYVGLRIAHSLVQSLINYIYLRFALFVLSTLALFGLSFQAARVLV